MSNIINPIDSDLFEAVQTVLFCSPEDEFPEYCYSGEFSITNDDVERFDAESLQRLQNSIDAFLNEAGIENREDYEESTGRNIVVDAIYTAIGSGMTFEQCAAYEHLRMCAKKHLGYLEFSGPIKGNDGKIYF